MSRYTIESRNDGTQSDVEYPEVVARARRLHAEAFDQVLRGVAGFFGKLVTRARHWNEKRRAVAQLSSLDDRSLRDIGLARSEIQEAVYGRSVGVKGVVQRFFATLEAARQGKVARDQLMSMDDRSLADIGLNRADVAYYASGEANKRAANEDRRVA